LRLSWLLRRRYRIGQSYASCAPRLSQRLGLLGPAAVKSAYSFLRAGLVIGRADRRAFWLMRGTMHAGVCAGCLKLSQAEHYGGAR